MEFEDSLPVPFPLEELKDEQITQLQTTLIELAHDAIIIRDYKSRIIAWNRGAQDLYGWTEEEVLGQVTHVLLQTRFPESREAIDLALVHAGRWEGELVHTTRDGARRVVDSRQVLVHSNGIWPAAILEVNRDITNQVQLFQERALAEATAVALRETARQMENFLSVVSHELKTPLTAISGNVQLARRQLERLKQIEKISEAGEAHPLTLIHKLLERAERQINVQSRLVNDLIDSSRIENDHLELNPIPCDLVSIIEQVVDEQRSMAPSRAIEWTTSTQHAWVLADPDRLGQVISNYLSNALKYSARNRAVSIQLKCENHMARVSVKDEGPGLSLEQQEHIWERFFRVKEIEAQGGPVTGLGLGLYICRNLIERQGGQVGVKSEPGAGAIFWFTLPLLDSTSET